MPPPNPSIQFTDAIGAATLTAGVLRLGSWQPTVHTEGARHAVTSTGALHEFAFRTDQAASFTVPRVKASDLAVAIRLVRHLRSGGQITINTQDVATRVYTASLRPDADPIWGYDPGEMLYSLTLEVINRGSADPMLCVYRA